MVKGFGLDLEVEGVEWKEKELGVDSKKGWNMEKTGGR